MSHAESSNEPQSGSSAQDAPSNPLGPAVPRDHAADESAATKFRQEVASRRDALDNVNAEESLWSGGYSPKAMVGTWFLLAVISLALLAAPFALDAITWPIVLGSIVVIWLLTVGWYFVQRLGKHYELTTQRFIHRKGIVTRLTDRIEVIDIDDVRYKQGPVQRIFGVGTIEITSSDRSHPELTMVGIDKVAEVAGLIDDVRRSERRKRSLHIEQI